MYLTFLSKLPHWLNSIQGPGDLWYFPAGIPHSLQATADDEDGSEFLLIFDDGSFSEDSTFLLSDWMSHIPAGGSRLMISHCGPSIRSLIVAQSSRKTSTMKPAPMLSLTFLLRSSSSLSAVRANFTQLFPSHPILTCLFFSA